MHHFIPPPKYILLRSHEINYCSVDSSATSKTIHGQKYADGRTRRPHGTVERESARVNLSGLSHGRRSASSRRRWMGLRSALRDRTGKTISLRSCSVREKKRKKRKRDKHKLLTHSWRKISLHRTSLKQEKCTQVKSTQKLCLRTFWI